VPAVLGGFGGGLGIGQNGGAWGCTAKDRDPRMGRGRGKIGAYFSRPGHLTLYRRLKKCTRFFPSNAFPAAGSGHGRR